MWGKCCSEVARIPVTMTESAHYGFDYPRVKTAPTAMTVMMKSAHFSVI